MKTQKRILNIRNQSRIDLPKVNLLFFNEGNNIDQQIPEGASGPSKNNDVIIFKENLNCMVDLHANLMATKKESPYVVDWQIGD